MRHLLLSAVSVVSVFAAGALAHDFWIEPSAFRAQPGDSVKFSLRVGDVFPGDAVPRNSSKIERFIAVGPSGEHPVTGRDGIDPAGQFKPTEDGLWIVGYRSRPSSVALGAEKFEGYLREKGLEHVIDARAAAGQSKDDASEIFSRCAKTLVRVGPGSEGADRSMGLRCEIVADGDPTAMKPGDTLRLRVLYEGQPAPGLLVTVLNTTGEASNAIEPVRTNAEGRAEIGINRPGLWIVNCVHMGRAPAESGAMWESLWASLTFDVAPAPRTNHDEVSR